MNPSLAVVISAMMLLSQGCDKVRGIMTERSGQGANKSGSASFSGPVVLLAEEDYPSFVNQKDILVVVNFGAAWCGPCRQLGPVLERVSSEFGDAVMLGKVDVDEARSVAMRNGVRSIPDVRFFRDGKLVHQFTGAQPESRIRETIQMLAEKAEDDDSQPESLIQRILPQRETDEKTESETEEKGPAIRPMEKDWLPPGIERR